MHLRLQVSPYLSATRSIASSVFWGAWFHWVLVFSPYSYSMEIPRKPLRWSVHFSRVLKDYRQGEWGVHPASAGWWTAEYAEWYNKGSYCLFSLPVESLPSVHLSLLVQDSLMLCFPWSRYLSPTSQNKLWGIVGACIAFNVFTWLFYHSQLNNIEFCSTFTVSCHDSIIFPLRPSQSIPIFNSSVFIFLLLNICFSFLQCEQAIHSR